MAEVKATLTEARKVTYNEKHAKDDNFDPLTGGSEEVSVEYDFGANTAEAVELFGDDVVHTNFRGSSIVTLQENLRRWKESGLSSDGVQAKADEWKPGVVTRTPGASFKNKVAEKFAGMDAEEQEKFMAMLMDVATEGGTEGGGDTEAPDEVATEA